MGDFLDVAHDLIRKNKVRDRKSFELVFDAIAVLPQVHSKATLDVDNVESVFSAFEMAQILGVFGDYEESRIAKLDYAMRQVITETVEKSMPLPTKKYNDHTYVAPPPPYEEFADLLEHVLEREQSCSVITLNYDLACDYALHCRNVPTIYALDSDEEPSHGVSLLKLHGSLNWARCPACQQIVPWRLSNYFTGRFWPMADMVSTVQLSLASELPTMNHCGAPVASGSVVVPPTWGKTSQHFNLARVWRRAAHELSEAENIFVIGYSMPPSDAFFKYLYALGTVGKTRIRRFWVWNPDPTVGPRFHELLGPGVQTKFQFIQDTFSAAIEAVARQFR
jgi:NAD-dependent SIR2 family protein deacetylase